MHEIDADDVNNAIARFVLRKATDMKRDPGDMVWLGDLIAEFMHSDEAKQEALIYVGDRPHEHDAGN